MRRPESRLSTNLGAIEGVKVEDLADDRVGREVVHLEAEGGQP